MLRATRVASTLCEERQWRMMVGVDFFVRRTADEQHKMVNLNGLAPATRHNESPATLLAALAWPMPIV
eukprot:13160521-Alexandrium_andersonii.AAC.1